MFMFSLVSSLWDHIRRHQAAEATALYMYKAKMGQAGWVPCIPAADLEHWEPRSTGPWLCCSSQWFQLQWEPLQALRGKTRQEGEQKRKPQKMVKSQMSNQHHVIQIGYNHHSVILSLTYSNWVTENSNSSEGMFSPWARAQHRKTFMPRHLSVHWAFVPKKERYCMWHFYRSSCCVIHCKAVYYVRLAFISMREQNLV